jgi:hypothetical protein
MPQRTILHLVTVRISFAMSNCTRSLLILKYILPLPPATSSGGRRTGPVSHPDSGQPPSGPDLRGQQQHEAPQGRDPSAESLDTRKEAAEALAARYRASRERLHEGHSSGVDFVGT